MKLYYHAGYRNFGDVMNPWFWQHFLPDLSRVGGDDIIFSGIGSILNSRLPVGRQNVVFGSGAGYGDIPGSRNWRFYAVRGPHTAQSFGLSEVAYGDPAILIPRILPAPELRHGKTIFVPHRESGALGGWDVPCNEAGIRYVNPQSDHVEVIRSIAGAGLVITESLHGAIIADAYRVPWIPVVMFHSSPFKWNDWTASVHAPYEPTFIDQQTVEAFGQPALRAAWKVNRLLELWAIRPGWKSGFAKYGSDFAGRGLRLAYLERRAVADRRAADLKRVLATSPRFLSPEGRAEELQDGLLEQVAQFKNDWN